MNSYAAIDGQVPAGSKAILRDLLRREMGFNGVTAVSYTHLIREERSLLAAGDFCRVSIESIME